jgi:hypothetical protein
VGDIGKKKKVQIGSKSLSEKRWDADWISLTLQGLSFVIL